MDKKAILRLRVSAQKLKSTLHIGKEGLSEKVLDELIRQIKNAKLVKIRVLSSYEGDRKEIARIVADKTSSALIDVRGSTIVLA